jgi:quercetin dioxygenase-like cupin family protein
MPNIKRYVIGPDQDGRSTVLETEPTNTQTKAGFYSRSTLWATQETPVNNTIEGDRALTEGLGARREPFPGGMLVRALELWPDTDPDEQRKEFAQLNAEVQQKHLPTAADAQRHPTMHRTDTLDCITVVRGEIYLITDTGEVLMTPGDTVIIRGVNHGWSNRSDNPCLLIGTMTDAIATGSRNEHMTNAGVDQEALS